MVMVEIHYMMGQVLFGKSDDDSKPKPALEKLSNGDGDPVELDRSRTQGGFFWDTISDSWYNPQTKYYYNKETKVRSLGMEEQLIVCATR